METLGMSAPRFNLKNFNPKEKTDTVSLDNFKEYPALLVAFICNHCPYVIHIRDSFIDFVSEFNRKGLGVVAINSNDISSYPEDSPQKMHDESEKYAYPFPYLFDETQDIAKAYKAACTPDFFLYNNKRELAYRGQYDSSRPKNDIPVTGEDLRIATIEVIGGKSVTIKQKPSMGCNIKWRKGNEPGYFEL